MKKTLLFCSVVAIFLSACFSPWEGENAVITLNFGGANRSIAVDDLANIFQHNITVSGLSGYQKSEYLGKGVSSTQFTVVPGRYNITVEAYVDLSDLWNLIQEKDLGTDELPVILQDISKLPEKTGTRLVATGNRSVDVIAGQINSIAIEMRWVEPSGSPEELEYVEIEDGDIIVAYRVIGRGTVSGNYVEIPLLHKNKPVWEVLEGALADCEDITEIRVSSNVTSIGFGAFSGCTGLTSITIPFVGDGTTDNTHFGWIFGAESYTDQNDTLSDLSNLKTVVITGGSSIAADAFFRCTGLESITIPASVTSIDNGGIVNATNYGAFYGCSSLTEITIPAGIVTIGYNAFNSCGTLATVTFQPGSALQTIGVNAFAYCLKLTDMTIPAGIVTIGNNAFYECDDLISVTFEGNDIDASSFSDNSFPGDLKEKYFTPEIGGEGTYTRDTDDNWTKQFGTVTFSEVKANGSSSQTTTQLTLTFDNEIVGLTTDDITLSDESITKGALIGSGPVYILPISNFSGGDLTVAVSKPGYTINDSSQLTTVYGLAYELITDDGVNNNTYRVRKGTINGGDVIIPETYRSFNVTEIGSVSDTSNNGAFYNTSITSVSIGSNVTTIRNYAFSSCTGLNNITIPPNVTDIFFSFNPNEGAFIGCTNLKNITINTSGTIGFITGYNKNWTNIFPADDLSVTFSADIGTAAFNGCNRLKSVTINNGVTTIGSEAFRNCTGLTEITIPASVTSIGNTAFSGCTGITSVIINEGDGVTIGNSAFKDCTNADFTSINIPASVTFIDGVAFENCTHLKTVNFTEDSRLNEIGSNAFKNCISLTGITIPASVTVINAQVFYGCILLTSVTFVPETIEIFRNDVFPEGSVNGDKLKTAYVTNGAGTYMRESGGSNWAYVIDIEDTDDWNGLSGNTLIASGEPANPNYYIINITENITNVTGFMANNYTFGDKTDINITINGGDDDDSKTITYSATTNGSMIRINASQTVTIKNLTLQGRESSYSSPNPLVYINGGEFIMDSGAIKDNRCTGGGGGVNVNNGTFIMNSGTISGNDGGSSGGGVHVSSNGTFIMNSGTISGNTAGSGGGVYSIGTFRIVNGTIYGTNDPQGLRNGAGTGSALCKNNGTAEYGIFTDFSDPNTWSGNPIPLNTGSTNARDDAIYVVEGKMETLP